MMTRRVSVEAVEEEEKEQLEVDVPVMSVQEGQICSMLRVRGEQRST